ncbi:uncharacterized protein C7orf57-like isoform X2 [Ptychodera flava]|uniref:uncharacterized protein C7orf57-like isoform X2 n=1 Tax=Ptychodera flava TaxID=63121 RepID=UPI00396A9441
MQDWFYHAPAKRHEAEPVEYPAPSQIPGLSGVILDDREDDTGTKRGYYKETDSKYVRLAKQGGRKDLLRFRSPKTLSDEPVPYPRPEWLDWDQNPGPDAGPRKVYLPEYMVYDEYKEDPDAAPYLPRRPPYSLNDDVSVFKREGDRKAIDKTVKLPEIRRPHRRHIYKNDANRPGGVEKPKGRRQPPENRPQVNEGEPIVFGKLLSMGYQQEWMNERERYYTTQRSQMDQKAKLMQNTDKTRSEYQDIFGKPLDGQQGSQKPHRRPVARTMERAERDHQQMTEEEKLFKLSKFEKVPAKVDSNRPKRESAHKTHIPTQQVELYA